MMRSAIVTLPLVLAACGRLDPVGPAEPYRPDLRAWVTPELALELDSTGRFKPEPPAAPPFEIIPESQAASLGEAYAHEFGRYFAAEYHRALGAPVPFDNLRAVGVFLGQTPHEPFPDPMAHPAFHRHSGPYYIVLLADEERIRVSVAVSALNHDLVVQDGQIRFPVYQGSEFRMQPFIGANNVITAEQAVEIAANRFGALVAQRPRYLLGDKISSQRVVPQRGTWVVVVSWPIEAQTVAGVIKRTDRVYVGLGGELYVAADIQPDAVIASYSRIDAPEIVQTTVARVPASPVRFDPIRPTEP